MAYVFSCSGRFHSSFSIHLSKKHMWKRVVVNSVFRVIHFLGGSIAKSVFLIHIVCQGCFVFSFAFIFSLVYNKRDAKL